MRITNRDMTCVLCGARNDAATGPERADVPDIGDVCLCFSCGGISIFTLKGTRVPTATELIDILKDPVITEAVEVIASNLTSRPFQDRGWKEEQ